MNAVLDKIIKQSKSYEEADFLDTIFGKFRKDVTSGSISVVLYGAGSAGKELYPSLKLHGVHPVCFSDNNSSRIGNLYCGVPVISYEELKKAHKESLLVITTSKYSQEITRQLLENGFCADRILCIEHNALIYYAHIPQWGWTLHDLQDVQQKLLEAYNLLTDQKSKDLFIDRIALFAAGTDYKSYRAFINEFAEPDAQFGPEDPAERVGNLIENYLYFNNDLIRFKGNEVLIDGGAFTGDSTKEFVKTCEKNRLRYKGIYCFEPDPGNYEKLVQKTSAYSNVTCFNLGLWSSSKTLQFESSCKIAAPEARIIGENTDAEITAQRTGNIKINTTSIDERFPNEKISFIKMDIEGAEIEAIRGAARTIAKHKPTLAISVYHKRNDIYDIPLLVHQICPEYKLYLRHFSNTLTDTVLIATV